MRVRILAMSAAACAALTGCGGGGHPSGGTSPPPPATYSVSGTVTGLTGALVLRVNDAADVTVNANGAVTLATSLANGASWSVAVKTQPANPTQRCTISNASGVIAAASVGNVGIDCVAVRLTLTASTPADHATNVARDAPITLTFSTTLDAATAGAAVSLATAAGDVASAASVSGQQLIVTPSTRLARLGRYTLTVSTGLHGSGGELLAAPVTLAFDAADGSWSEAVTLDSDAGGARNPHIALDGAGNALAIWQQAQGGRVSVLANHFKAASSVWEGALAVDSSDTEDAFQPDVRFDANGNALAVWAQGPSLATYIWSARFYGASAWGTPARIEAQSGSAEYPEIAIDAAGNALATWTKQVLIGGSGGHEAHASQFTLASGWSATQQALSPSVSAYFPQVCFDDAGKALAIWYQDDLSGTQVWGNAFLPGTGWGTAAPIEKIDGTNADGAQIACNGDGSAFAVWRRHEPGAYVVHAAQYSPVTGWGTPIRLDSADSSVWLPKIAVDAHGNATVIWGQSDATNLRVWSRRYVAGSGWGVARQLDGPDVAAADSPSLAINARGDAVVAWTRVTGGGAVRVVRAVRALAGAEFGAVETLDRDDARLASNVRVAIDAAGGAIAVWQKGDGTQDDIQAARFE